MQYETVNETLDQSCSIFKAFSTYSELLSVLPEIYSQIQVLYKVESGTNKTSDLVEKIRLDDHSGLSSLNMFSFSEIPE